MGIFNFDVAHGYNKIFGVIRAKQKKKLLTKYKTAIGTKQLIYTKMNLMNQ